MKSINLKHTFKMKLYKISAEGKRANIWLLSQSEIGLSVNDFTLICGEYAISDGHAVKVEDGTYWRDFIKLNSNTIVVSKRISDILKQHSVTGIKLTKLTIENFPEKEYYAMQIVSNPVSVIMPDIAGWNIGLNVELSEYDGSDFFLLKNKEGTTAVVICTEKVYQILNKKKYNNIQLTPINEWRYYTVS